MDIFDGGAGFSCKDGSRLELALRSEGVSAQTGTLSTVTVTEAPCVVQRWMDAGQLRRRRN